MKTVTWILVMAAVSLVTLTTACHGRLAHQFDEKFTQVVELPSDVRRVQIEVLEGAVSISAGEPGEVKLLASTRRASDTVEGLELLRGIDLRLQPDTSRPGVFALRGPTLPDSLERLSHRMITKVVVTVPPELEVAVVTGLGHVSAAGRRAQVWLETGHGDLRLEDCRADASLRSGQGVVIVQGHRGGLDIETGESQTMQVFIDELGAAGLRLVTRTGSIQAHLPSGVGFELEAETKWGLAANGFGVPIEPIEGTGRGKVMRGEVAGGGPPVVLRAVEGGNLSLSERGR